MTQPRDPATDVKHPSPHEDRDGEHERIRSSNDRDQEMDREGDVPAHNRGYDSAVDAGRTETDRIIDADDDDPGARSGT